MQTRQQQMLLLLLRLEPWKVSGVTRRLWTQPHQPSCYRTRRSGW